MSKEEESMTGVRIHWKQSGLSVSLKYTTNRLCRIKHGPV